MAEEKTPTIESGEIPSPPNEKVEAALPIVDVAAENKLLRKIDLRLMTPIWIMFMFGFLDRINLGNVAALGIIKDLHLTGNKLNVALQVFFVPYILLEIPSNIVLKKIKPAYWLSGLTFCWGICCLGQGFVKSEGGLVACRFLMGIFESGYNPGCAYLMSMYYKRHEFQKRFSFFWVAGLIAGAFGGLLAYALEHMTGISGYAGWRWIFIIEGLLSIAAALPSFYFVADWPEHATFLTNDDRELMKVRRLADRTVDATMDRLDRNALKRIFGDWKLYVGSLMYLGVTVSGYSTSLFIPTIIKSLGYSGVESQIHSIPIWVVAAVVTMISAYLTDRLQHRYGFVMFGVLFSSIGYIILLCQGSPKGGLDIHVRYMAVFFVCTGCYIVQPALIVWFANNISGHYKTSIGLAIELGFGNIGGIIASNIFVSNEAPRYFVGYGVALAFMLFCGIMCTIFAIGLNLENKKRDRGERDDRLLLPAEEVNNLGDDHPSFRYAL